MLFIKYTGKKKDISHILDKVNQENFDKKLYIFSYVVIMEDASYRIL